MPLLYIILAALICCVLLVYKPQYTWPGLIIVLIGIPIYFAVERSRKNLPDFDVMNENRRKP